MLFAALWMILWMKAAERIVKLSYPIGERSFRAILPH
jgi:hypothetical protein